VHRQSALLVRGRVLTVEPELWSDALLVDGPSVVALGSEARSAGRGAPTIDLGEQEIAFAGFADPHLHLLSTAAAECSVDAAKPSLRLVLEAIAAAAAGSAPQAWIRAVGYDDAFVEERRHPSRSELDAVSAGRPTVLHHRTGHAAILNSVALAALGIEDPPEGPLVDRHDLLERVPPLPSQLLLASLDRVLENLSRLGIVSVTDATHTNDRATLELLDRPTRLDVQAMLAWDRLDGLRYRERVGSVVVGPAKIMPGPGGGALATTRPRAQARAQPADLGGAVATAHRAGFPVAIHVMEIDTMGEALEALSGSPPPAGTRDRIEHCSLALPEQLDALAKLPVEVVTQPSFVNRRALKYREQLSATEQDWLWPLASLMQRGIPVRYSSDAPVVPARPAEWLAAATRRELNATEEVSWVDALKSATAAPLVPGASRSVVIFDRESSLARRLR